MNEAGKQTAYALKKANEAITMDGSSRYAEALDAYREAILALENVLAHSDDAWQDDDGIDHASGSTIPGVISSTSISELSRRKIIELRNQYVQRVDLLIGNLPPNISAIYSGKGFGVAAPKEMDSMTMNPPDHISTEPFEAYDAFFEVVASDDPNQLGPPEPEPEPVSYFLTPPITQASNPRRPFWMMRLLCQTMTSGGMLTPRLHVPRHVWFQSGARFVSIESKFSACEQLYVGLKDCRLAVFGQNVAPGLYKKDEGKPQYPLDPGSVYRSLTTFETVMEVVKVDICKKLRYLDLSAGGSAPGGSSSSSGGTIGRSGSSGSLSSGGTLGRTPGFGEEGDQQEKSVGGMFKKLLLLTKGISAFSSQKTERVADLSAYVALLVRMFSLCQMLDDWILYFENNQHSLKARILESLERISQFFDSAILLFVMKDLNILLERYLRKMAQITLLP